MKSKVLTRMGDGERIRMDVSQLKDEILKGSADAAEKAEVAPLNESDAAHLLDIVTEPERIVSVLPGEEVIVTDDGCSMSFYAGQESSGIGLPLSRLQAVLAYERICGADSTSLGHSDYSYKPVKPIVNFEMNDYYTISTMTTAPFLYGAQPNMGLYFQPDGPCPNPSVLFTAGDIPGARQAQEDAAAQLEDDLIFVGRELAGVGCEGLNFDTAGSAGDAEFAAALRAVAALKSAVPDLPIIMGAAGDFVIGMHGEMAFNGARIAGMYPHQQAAVVESAGADIFGLAVGTDTEQTVVWNIARTVTMLKAARKATTIPIHVNVGMGVGGVPMMEETPVDSVTRVSKALVQIGKADGL